MGIGLFGGYFTPEQSTSTLPSRLLTALPLSEVVGNEIYWPPATAGMIETVSPGATGVSNPCR